ncbi:MAG: hypothetical protein BWX60_01068 [Candidatus Marinimicrobia bacterium ADurb.Bin030]|jgi:hypothetical protein|nr:MAG: hypothetical protein BWX60_01068 [Candidatus Marinimicrobia bacterium ADurb.Bin030]
MTSEFFGTINRAMLTASTAETYHQISELPFDVITYSFINNGIDVIQEFVNVGLFF